MGRIVFIIVLSLVAVCGAGRTSRGGDGFVRAVREWRFSFPRDYGRHPGFQDEWWYFSGNLLAENGEAFGYELAFFRHALAFSPPHLNSAWRVRDIYLAHLAISSVKRKKMVSLGAGSRSLPLVAGASEEDLYVHIRNWRVKRNGRTIVLKAGGKGFFIHLTLSISKPPVLHGVKGLCQKGKRPGEASYYYSLTCLRTKGMIKFGGKRFIIVKGKSWFDREFFTRQLGGDQTGWDWFSLQFDNDTELMLYLIRRKDGIYETTSSGTMVLSSGRYVHLRRSDFEVDILKRWNSPKTKATYPMKWKIEIPPLQAELTVSPAFEDQEFLSHTPHMGSYWEGYVTARGKINNEKVRGAGYMEMTGYTNTRSK